MDSKKEENTLISNEKISSKNNNIKKIKISKFSINDCNKNIIKRNNSSLIKLPSIKCYWTKNNSKYTINRDNDENKTINYRNIQKNDLINKNNINLLYSNSIDNQVHNYKNKESSNGNQLRNNYNLNKNLKKSSSTICIFNKNSNETFSKYKIPNIHSFHRNLMSINKISHDKSIKEKYLKLLNQNKNFIETISEDKNKKSIKTGIFGPSNNIVSVIRAKMERLKYDNEYKGVDDDIKELIKDEIMDAQVKLKRKPINLFINKNNIRPLYLKKMDKYRYLSSMNKIREINQMSSVSVLVKDGNVMLKLINDAFNFIRKENGENH